jgi:RNA polymerase sigma-70 factor (ECF subfamily)
MAFSWVGRAVVTQNVSAAMEPVETPVVLGDLAARAVHDPQAGEELLARVRDMAVRYARVRLGRFGAEDTAQDVAQEVCMAVMIALPTYEDRGLPFEALVYTIASRKLADVQRQAMRGPSLLDEIPDGADDQPTPEQAALARDELESALRLMRTLPEQQREILTLRVAVGLSTEETAAALGMTTGAVRVSQHRALTKLRAMIAQLEAGDVA